MTAVGEFNITLHHLTADGRQAGAQLPDVDLKDVTPEKLRSLLETLAGLASRCEYPTVPELRIAGPQGRFLVQAKNGQVRVTSWSASTGSADLTPDRIFALIMGEAVDDGDLPASVRPLSFGGLSRRAALVVLVAAILLTNGATAWLLTRPPEPIPTSLLPAHEPVSPEQARRILADFAGTYETGGEAGDRSLVISADGRLTWARFGPNRAVEETQELTAQAAQAGGRTVLVANNFGMIEAKDPITITFFGDTYRRKSP